MVCLFLFIYLLLEADKYNIGFRREHIFETSSKTMNSHCLETDA